MVLTSDLGAVSFSYPLMKKRQRVHLVLVFSYLCRVQGYGNFQLPQSFEGRHANIMAYQEFIVLYTHQKTKKSKVWQDGILKAVFGGNKVGSVWCTIKPGDDFESERYLITVESENVPKTDYNQSKNTEKGKLTSNSLKSLATSSLCHPKRKYSDFQIPRQVEKKKLVEESALPSTSEVRNAMVSSGYHTFSQNIRSRAKIIALLSHDQHVSKRLENETTASLKNLQFTMMQSESNPEVLLQRKSRWDVYMPSCLSDVHAAENNNENINNLQSIEKSLNERECVNRSQSNDHKGIPPMPSWKLGISPVSKGSTGSQPYNFFPSESFMHESNNSELSSLDHANLNCGNALKTFEDSSESSRHGMNGNLERSCPVTDFANPGKEFTEVNFNLLNMLDFNDTEDNNPNENSIVSQGSVCLKQEIKNQVEVSGEKNCDVTGCNSERKDNIQLEFLQDHDLNRISGSQPLPLCDEISTKPVNIKENNIAIWEKKWQNSEVFINDKVDTNALYQNVDIHQQLPCASRNLIMENDVDCEMHDIKQSFAEAYCPEDLQIPCLHSDSPNLVVEFHGYQVKGSAASKMMTRKGCLYQRKDPQRDMIKSESASKDAFFSLAQELNCPGVPEFVNVQKMISVTAEPKRLEMNSMFLKKKAVINFVITKTASFKPPSQIVINSSNLDFAESASREFNKDTSDLHFPRMDMVKNTNVPKRQQRIPVEFQSPAHYKKVFTTALIALGKVDISFYSSSVKEGQRESSAPLCSHKIAAKLVMVRKEGRNKGRLFYACDAAKADRCDFFKWLEDVKPVQMESKPCIILHDMKSIGTYLRCQRISIYEECQLLIRKMFDTQRKLFGKMKRCNIAKASLDCDSKRKLFLKLNRREHSSTYSKDDLWVVSKTLTFEPLDTFIAYSVFFGPSSNNEVELEPLNGYSPSNWRSDMIVHALFVCNASTELTNLRNIQEHVSSITLPIMQHLLTKKEFFPKTKERKQKFKPPGLSTNAIKSDAFSPEIVINLADKIIQAFQLNKDQATAMMQIGAMMTSQEINTETAKHLTFPITIIHGVFGSGKSLLLAIVILFLTQIFEIYEAANDKRSVPWKILVSSSTNVAVDRILLSFECEKLILVGDPKQLPPTIQGSESAHDSGLEQTLFDRLCLMGYAPILLRTQYRCHPVIAAITNELFYEGILLNGISEIDRSPLLDWLPTLCFYSVNGSEQIEADNSFYNMAESFFIVKLIQSLVASGVDGSVIGVITLYKSQMSKIRNLFGAIHMDAAQIKTVQVSTVDAFQGAEKEIIVLSCVRTRQVGFIDSEKRVNVALTRGKRHLLIVGNLNCLRKNKLWGSVIQHCTGRKNGLQHANQCEQQLNDIVKSYFNRKMEEEAIMKKKKSKNESLSQKTNT
ncbi:hypothetical protein E2320_007622 [Naja naja]|nr:hypothetical protein E2320_007622 [Naja naja]